MLSWTWFCPEACSPQDLGKDAVFWAYGTAWATVVGGAVGVDCSSTEEVLCDRANG